MKGTIYGVGVGPGDPELMTLKAVRLIRENDIIAVPGKIAAESTAYKIAAAAVPEIADKTLVPVYMPMVKDREMIRKEHEKGAKMLETYLDQGKNVVYLTLGDSTIYCTFSYLQHFLEEDGYPVELVSGIPSFCAAAARLNLPLTEWDEPLHIIPAVHKTHEPLHYEGNYVLMKAASHMKEIKELLAQKDLLVNCVENCSMENEKVYRSLEEIPDDTGYFSLIIAKEPGRA
ncbi:MAG: precorrin-2 C(20)-methyltransferase [Lachnospiraceae bacterium]|nr:precorrin-2 C(20)-methyltransferase [Lachnospiraceae bacterium]